MSGRKRVYLAGPEVFLRNASEVMARKGQMALDFGFEPSTLAEDGVKLSGNTPHEFGMSIGVANETMMDASDFIIANLTPFRGISADVGTAFEVGYMRAQGKPCFGYTNTDRDYYTRLTVDYYSGGPFEEDGDVIRARDGLMIENHTMIDNLMLDTAIILSGGSFVAKEVSGQGVDDELSAYHDALVAARAFFDAQK
ncbi:nucleoside 2-deoxyribosyltransferase [Celeribacter sp.]|uniref:nucleoside 2-deoxyribosyltransferase n=1 Tax=Celeribacter sp. TaxID=1890673 RepID=UPI003A90FFFD